VTITPGITAPVGSFTLPVSAEVLPVWAIAGAIEIANTLRTTMDDRRSFFDFTPNPLCKTPSSALCGFGCALYSPQVDPEAIKKTSKLVATRKSVSFDSVKKSRVYSP
jgi:hypothetical protein